MSRNQKISESELSRRINISAPKLRKAVARGLVTPDEIIMGRVRLFDVSRVETIKGLFAPSAKVQVTA